MQAIISFVMSHELVVASAVIGVIDLIMALVPKLESNGVLHFIYLSLKNVVAKK